jgi:mRNA interferase HigB
MRVISKNPKVPDFWSRHPDAEKPLMGWYREAKRADWKNFADVRQSYGSVSLAGKFIMFNIGGNKFRLITIIEFKLGIIFIKHVLTHEEYDEDKWKNE